MIPIEIIVKINDTQIESFFQTEDTTSVIEIAKAIPKVKKTLEGRKEIKPPVFENNIVSFFASTVRVKKSLVQKFLLKKNDKIEGSWWAVFYVDSGLLSIQSDYGDYSYRWSSYGESFKDFLLSIDGHYLMTKLSGGSREFMFDETIKRIKKDIIKMRRSYPVELSEKDAREVWDDLVEWVKETGTISSNHYFYEHLPSSIVNKVYTNEYLAIPNCTEFPVQLQMFVEKIWPEFKKVLKDSDGL